MSKNPNPIDPQPTDEFDSSQGTESPPNDEGGQMSDAGEPTIEEQLQSALNESAANHDRFLRTQAELENYRRRVQKEREEDRKFAPLPIVRELLPVLDNLQRAIDAADKSDSVVDLKAGVEMVLQQSIGILKKLQVAPIAAVGEPFDPNVHEAISQMPSADHPPMSVIVEVERGYTLHDRVIRPSKVIVSTGPPPANN